MNVEPELIADYQCVTGEGPLWHHGERRLYWTDISTGRMFRYDPTTGTHEQFYAGEGVGGFTITTRKPAHSRTSGCSYEPPQARGYRTA